MKDVILIMDEDVSYSKRFCSKANKVLGKKYIFLTFTNIKSLHEYAGENKIEALIVSENYLEKIEDVSASIIYVLNEKDKNFRKEGKKTYVYKLQNIKYILDALDKDIEDKNVSRRINQNDSSKLVLFFSPSFIKNKKEIIKKISRIISKKKKVLIIELDEFDNYKGKVGLSNIIYGYKENSLSFDALSKEVVVEKDQEYIKSITYPEDYNVISNIDLANIVNEILKLPYDFIFVNSDTSYVRCQYILNDADKVILFKEKNNEKNDNFKHYLRNENNIDFKKVNELDLNKLDKSYLSAFTKQVFEAKK